MRTVLSGMRRLAAAALLVVSAGACNEFLTAENPGAIEAPDLNDPAYIALMVNGVIGEFQNMYTQVSHYNALYSDELHNHHVFFEERLIDRRDVHPENGTFPFFYYTPLQRSRFMADTVTGRLRVLLGDTASRDVRLARTLVYSGFNYILLGENLCLIPLTAEPGNPLLTSDETIARAALRFEEAIAVATAARAYNAAISPATTASTAAVAGSDSLINAARVGAARAYLWLNDKPRALTFAQPVPAGFVFWAYYLSGAITNYYQGRLSTGSSGSNTGSLNNTPFLAMAGDPRVPRPATDEPMQNGLRGFIPNSPTAASTYSGTPTGADFTLSSWMRIASGLEAQYIVAESQGPTAETLTFVNQRRAAGGQLAVTLTGDPLMAELRDQRRRDLYLDSHRLGDLRRYKRYYGVNEYPLGPYPGTTSGETYTTQEAWPLPLSEVTDNPNVTQAPTCGR
jgi:hypothetical protein